MRDVEDAPARSDRSALRVALRATTVGLVAFLSIQGILATYNVDVLRDAISRGWIDGYPSTFLSLPLRLLNASVAGAPAYLVFALAGIAIASRGHRVLFAAPAAGFVFLTIAFSQVHQPRAIGSQWQLGCWADPCSGPWFAHPWVGALVDLALVLLPGVAVRVRVRASRWPPMGDPPAVAAIVVAAALIPLTIWTTLVISPWQDVSAMIALGAFGLAIGTARPWWPWLHVLLGALFGGALVGFLDAAVSPTPGYGIPEVLRYSVEPTVPMIVVGLLASSWQPLAWLFRRLQDRPLHGLVAANVLNVADAVLTALAVRSGGALEANPLVRLGGLPAKILLVGVLTWVLYRRRPSVLVWPAAALLWVVCYHVGGILVNGWH